jgi:hypothetical protein
MNYAGWLRVRNCLRVCGIVAAIIAVLAIGARAYLATNEVELDHGHGQVGIHSRSATVIVDSNHAGTAIPNPAPHRSTKLGYYANEPFVMDIATPLALGVLFAWVVATILGGPLARENDGHLEIAWTKPASRTAYALSVMAVDAVGILAALAIGTALAVVVILLFAVPQPVIMANTFPAIAVAILAGLAWYAMCAAFTASLKRNWRAIPGLAWPAAFILLSVALVGAAVDSNPVLKGIHVLITVVNYFNPLLYSLISNEDGVTRVPAPLGSPILSAVALMALIAIYVGASLVQWRRVEA